MGSLLIVANLKSYKNESEAKVWVSEFIKQRAVWDNLDGKEIVICPSFTLLPFFSSSFSDTKIKIGAQNVSPFEVGAYTGEVNAKQIKDFATYVIVGHSERRKYFGENDSLLAKKTILAKTFDLTPIYCIQNNDAQIPEGVQIIAYEPDFAIGSGNPDTCENASKIAKILLEKNPEFRVLYGGSVTADNVSSFTKAEGLKGVLVGGASLDAAEFIKIIENA